MNRRDVIKTAALATGGLVLGESQSQAIEHPHSPPLKGNFKHSVSRWCYNFMPFEQLCTTVKSLGMHSIELTGPAEWEVMKKYGLTCAIGWDTYPEGVTLDNFLTNPNNHDALEEYYMDLIPKAVEYGVKNLICLSGRREGRSNYENMINCKKMIDRVIGFAEDNDITISIELLNSKKDHKDHQFDNMEWGVALCEMIGSDNFKILYDIYHAQIMEGDVVATIRKYSDYISHYHTAGVPGRHEIDNRQELNYHFIMEEIKNTGYQGYIGQEFIPTGQNDEEKIASLRNAVHICDV